MPGRDRFAQVRDRLARWRAKHGGRGIRIPETMWAEVVEVAQVEGVEATAHALQLDPARLTVRMTAAGTASGETAAEASGGFVELDAGRLGLSPRTVIRFQGQDGERGGVELDARQPRPDGRVGRGRAGRPAAEAPAQDPHGGD